MSPQKENIEEMIGYLLSAGYTWEQIEEMLDIEVHFKTLNLELVTMSFRSRVLGEFEVNAN